MPNLRSKIFRFFPLLSTLDFEFFSEGRVQSLTFFDYANFEVKNFSKFCHLLSALFSIFWRGIQTPTFFSHAKISGQKIFIISFFTKLSGLLIFLGTEGMSMHKLCLVTPNFRSKSIQNFFLYLPLWSLNFFGGGLGTNVF